MIGNNALLMCPSVTKSSPWIPALLTVGSDSFYGLFFGYQETTFEIGELKPNTGYTDLRVLEGVNPRVVTTKPFRYKGVEYVDGQTQGTRDLYNDFSQNLGKTLKIEILA